MSLDREEKVVEKVVLRGANYVVMSGVPSENELQELDMHSYILVKEPGHSWKLLFINLSQSKKTLEPRQEQMKNLEPHLPEEISQLSGDKNKQEAIEKMLKLYRLEVSLLNTFEGFLIKEAAFYKDMKAFLNLIQGNLAKSKESKEFDGFLEPYKNLLQNPFPEHVDVTKAEKIEDKFRAYEEILAAGMQRPEFEKSIQSLDMIVATYEKIKRSLANKLDNNELILNPIQRSELESYLIKPVQQFTQYVLRLDGLLKQIEDIKKINQIKSTLGEQLSSQKDRLDKMTKKKNERNNKLEVDSALGRIADGIIVATKSSMNLASQQWGVFEKFSEETASGREAVRFKDARSKLVGGFIYKPTMEAFVDAFCVCHYENKDTDLLKIMRDFIKSTDSKLHEIGLNGVVFNRETNKTFDFDHQKDAVFDELVLNSLQNADMKMLQSEEGLEKANQDGNELRNMLIRKLFDKIKDNLRKRLHSPEDEHVFKRTLTAITAMGPLAVDEWNKIANNEFFELLINRVKDEKGVDNKKLNKAEEDKLKESYDNLLKLEVEEKDRKIALVKLIAESYGDAFVKTTQEYKKDKRELPEFVKISCDRANHKIQMLMKIAVDPAINRAQLRNECQSVMVDILADAYRGGRKKAGILWKGVSVADSYLSAVLSSIRKTEQTLQMRGQKTLVVSKAEDFKGDDISDAELLFNRVALIRGTSGLGEHIKTLYEDLKKSLIDMMPLLDSPAELKKFDDKKNKEGAIYLVRKKLVNTLKIIERLDPENLNQVKKLWNDQVIPDVNNPQLQSFGSLLLIDEHNTKDGKIKESKIKDCFDEKMKMLRKAQDQNKHRSVQSVSHASMFSSKAKVSTSGSADVKKQPPSPRHK